MRPLVSESASTHLMPSDRCFLFWGTSGFSPQSENQPLPHIPLYSQCSAHAQFILGDGNGSTVYLLQSGLLFILTLIFSGPVIF